MREEGVIRDMHFLRGRERDFGVWHRSKGGESAVLNDTDASSHLTNRLGKDNSFVYGVPLAACFTRSIGTIAVNTAWLPCCVTAALLISVR